MIRAPRKTFTAVAGAPRWAGVLAVGFLAAAPTTALVFQTRVGQLALLDRLERAATAFGRPVDDAGYRALQRVSDNGAAYAVVTSFVSGPLLAVGVSAVLAAAFRAMNRGDATYRQVLAIVSHAGVILALRQVVAAPVVYARETLASPLTLGIFFSMLDEASPLARFTGMVDLFVIWWLAVLATGMSVLYGVPARRLAVIFGATYVGLAGLLAVLMTVIGGTA